MAAPSGTKASAGSGQQTGIYVYGILPADVKLTEKIRGVGNGKVTLVRSGKLAALVSEVNLGQPLGTPEDLEAHRELADSAATGSPILPLRFGAVLDSEDAVVEELLEAHRDEFTAALRELEGRAQYVVRGRYLEPAILREILTENREAAELREQIRGAGPDAARNEQIRLGEIINDAIDAKRQQDTNAFVQAAQGSYVAGSLREPTHELDAVYVSFLVEDDQADELRQAVDDLARDQEGRIEFGVRGPMAPWDFVGGGQEAQS
jgi:Gas vesicle synthesis protein GvpL/GvpF